MKPHIGSEVNLLSSYLPWGVKRCEVYEIKYMIGGHGFESRWSPDFFQGSSFQLLKLENLLQWSFFTFKCSSSLSDPFISVMNSTRPRRTVSSKGTLLYTIRPNTVTFENSFYCRAPRIWSSLPAPLRNTDCSVAHFKKDLFNYYLYLTKSIYDVDPPSPLRVCISATLASHWTACSIVCVVDFLSMSSTILFL